MGDILDSGARREFNSGAVRDIAEGKGRCDLLPLGVVAIWLDDIVLDNIDNYVRSGAMYSLINAMSLFCKHNDTDLYTAVLEVSKQYEAGAVKYSDRNWEKGIPLHCFIDSGVRHYLKFQRGDNDEPHDRAFLWNLLGALWTQENHPELIVRLLRNIGARDIRLYVHILILH